MNAEKLDKVIMDLWKCTMQRGETVQEYHTRKRAILTRAIEEEAQNKKWDEHISNITIENLRGQRDTLRAQLADLREALRKISSTAPGPTMMNLDAKTSDPWEKKMANNHQLIAREALARVEARKPSMPRPKIVCLCGSTRFMEQFFNSGWDETMKGNIVLSVGVNLKMETPDGGHIGEAMGPEIKEMLDELHKRKIDLADEALVLNVGGYIGESTASEIAYAIDHGKLVRYLEPPTTDTP